jgi:thymidylate synthase (FAD)
MRSLMHFLDLRAKADAQLEIRQLCELMFQCFHSWSPEVAEWYKETRWSKARLSP